MATRDTDSEVAERARAWLLEDLDPPMLNELSLAALASPAGETWIRTRRLPHDAGLAVVYCMLTGREEEAESRDPDGELLRKGATRLPDQLRHRLTATLRSRGLAHLTTIAMGLDWRDPIRAERHFDVILPELVEQQRFTELWRLAFLLPMHRARLIIQALADCGFQGGTVWEHATKLAAMPVPEAEPERKVAGRLIAWAGDRLYRAQDENLVCEDWRTGRQVWSIAPLPNLQHTTLRGAASPNGLWLGTQRREGWLFDQDGECVYAQSDGLMLYDWMFSPCSSYALLRQTIERTSQPGPFELFRLNPFERILSGHYSTWHWHGGDALQWTPEGVTKIVLATGERMPVTLPVPWTGHPWVSSPSGQSWFCQEPSATRVWLGEKEEILPAGEATFLCDDRLMLHHGTYWSVWDGLSLRKLPYEGRARVDPVGCRLVGSDDKITRVCRIGEPKLVRSLEGKFLARHPSEPYLATQVGDEILIWHVPVDFMLVHKLPEDAELLEPHDRELARLLLTERCRHEIVLEDEVRRTRMDEIEL